MSKKLEKTKGSSVNVQPLVRRLREKLQLTEQDSTDEEILKNTHGTLLRAGIEIGIAKEELVKAINEKVQM